ncbi:fungal-specific transcription factor domain-containing protein [Gloeopeniophorella convolvens]|nr:fungal-specific transcription factor domain-containing protein [Gloeopeniophorella convolvens]
MSSAEEDINDADGSNAIRSAKKRRVQRACDVCRRKKIRCDGVGQTPGSKCTNCHTYSFECTYEEAAKKRGPPKGYVESLESRLEKMEGLLQRLCPDADFSQELGAPVDRQAFMRDSSLQSSHNTPGTASYRPRSPLCGRTLTGPLNEAEDPDLDPSDDDLNAGYRLQILEDTFSDLHVSYRFFGKSSGVNLVQTALDLKSEYNSTEPDPHNHMANRRREFWTQHSWERAAFRSDPSHYAFPEPDLIRHLVDLYFLRINLFLPLLHRQTFERNIREGLHERDEAFGSVLLCVCACASRYSVDPRVLLEDSKAWHSSGWKWFAQVQMLRRSLVGPTSLHDVQMYALACLFLQGCSAPQSCWTMIGIGLRLAQDVGAHRKKVYGNKPSFEDEQWRRAFWVLVVLDRLMSASLGRPCAIQEEDFDVDLPMDVDDEFWQCEGDQEPTFKQPQGKPSLLSYFNCFIKLNQILAFALRTIYSINKSKILLGFVGQQWEQHIVAELDSALNKWIDTVPSHLKWDTTGHEYDEDRTWFLQSASLYSHYYHLQILVHRPFIPSPRKPSPLSFPSLAICTNAARSCAHVVDLQRRLAPEYPSSHFQLPAFTAGIVLLLNIWGVKRSGLTIDPVKEMEDVHKCMGVLKAAEGRWHAAGRLWDVLYELASVGKLPLPQPSPPSATKRERDADSPASQLSSASTSSRSALQPPPPQPPPHQPQRASISPPMSSMRTPFVDSIFSHGAGGFAQQPPPDILTPQPTAQSFAYTPLPRHSDEIARMPPHAFSAADAWLTQAPPPQPQHHTHQPHQHQQPQHMQMYEQATYGTPPAGVDAFTTFQLGGLAAGPQAPQPADGGVDMWQSVPSSYDEFAEWGSYISSVSGIPPGHSGPPH